MLQLVLNDDEEAAKLLAAEVHRDVKLTDVNVARDFPNDELNYSEIGIWVDPIGMILDLFLK